MVDAGIDSELVADVGGCQGVPQRRQCAGDPLIEFGVDAEDRRFDKRDLGQIGRGPIERRGCLQTRKAGVAACQVMPPPKQNPVMAIRPSSTKSFDCR